MAKRRRTDLCRSKPHLQLAHASATPSRQAPYLGLVRPDAKGHLRDLINEMSEFPQDSRAIEGGIPFLVWLAYARGAGEIPFDWDTYYASCCIHDLIKHLKKIAALLESGPDVRKPIL
jgi:hypothetical protein